VGHVAGIIVVDPTLVYIVGAAEVTMVKVTAVFVLVGHWDVVVVTLVLIHYFSLPYLSARTQMGTGTVHNWGR